MPVPHRKSTIVSFGLFVAGASLLRLGSIAGWAFFPGEGYGVRFARIVLPGLFTTGLVWLNECLLRRDHWPSDSLGLRPSLGRGGWFVTGGLAITLVLLLLLGALWLQVPFHFKSGSLGWGALAWCSAEYFVGNFGEELVFRGYLLLTLARCWGDGRAVLASSVLFGLFHLPGLSGVVALKMVCTTFLGGCLYAYGFLLTRTLWMAVGMHVVGNVVLHRLSGFSGQSSLWSPTFDGRWPDSYDPAFVAWLGVLIPILAIAAGVRRRGWCAAGSALSRAPDSPSAGTGP